VLHHLSIGVTDLERAAAFYDAALGALGYVRVWNHATAIGYGIADGEDLFAIKLQTEGAVAAGPGFHVAFSAPSRHAVDRFHQEALTHGGIDNGPAGLRPAYGANYYAAFVIDPDGSRIEAVISAPQAGDPAR
jgi:catechol 2,3-dioxygenase-like lactoylglutathione lyase family enzyme